MGYLGGSRAIDHSVAAERAEVLAEALPPNFDLAVVLIIVLAVVIVLVSRRRSTNARGVRG